MTDSDHTRLERLRAWVERFATHVTNTHGWPPITGRTLGWLLNEVAPSGNTGNGTIAI